MTKRGNNAAPEIHSQWAKIQNGSPIQVPVMLEPRARCSPGLEMGDYPQIAISVTSSRAFALTAIDDILVDYLIRDVDVGYPSQRNHFL